MNAATFRLVMLVSCAHALVHVYEVSLPSVEMEIAATYSAEDPVAGKRMTGWLSTTWRLPWGLGALLAGWLVDRYGTRRMLVLYLAGCSLVCLLIGLRLPLPMLFLAMFSMGTMASIYHPAGLGLISHSTTIESRPKALGVHGIFGSAGIAFAPFLIGLLQSRGLSWHTYYQLLAIPGLLLGGLLLFGLPGHAKGGVLVGNDKKSNQADWRSFFLLTGLALLQGFVYSGVVSFLPRYIRGAELTNSWLTELSTVSLLTSLVLLLGCVGQYLAGYLSNPHRLERQLTYVTLANAPLLVWMALAGGLWRAVAAGAFAVVHFMHQPLYNSLIAKYSPARRRSLCYGFSFAMGLGLGSFGASFAGSMRSDTNTYLVLAGVACLATIAGAYLWKWNAGKG